MNILPGRDATGDFVSLYVYSATKEGIALKSKKMKITILIK